MTKGADFSAPLLCKKGVFDFQYNNINGFIYTLPTDFSKKGKSKSRTLALATIKF